MPLYRQKRTAFTAVQYVVGDPVPAELQAWIDAGKVALMDPVLSEPDPDNGAVETLRPACAMVETPKGGDMALDGDYIVQMDDYALPGLYVSRQADFEATFEAAV